MRIKAPLARTAAALLAAGLLISGCSGGSSPDPSARSSLDSSAKEALKPYATQKLKWRECGVPGFECATLRAPLDYAKPDDGQIKLAVSRKKATGPGKRIGSLMVNPGGPGGSAIEYLQAYAALGYPAPVRARYDMVGMDPRGVARSEPVECLDDKAMDAYTQTDVTPDDEREQEQLVTAYKEFAQGCEKRSATVLPHVSTVEAARDMDLLREVLGDDKLYYVGASYGTFLGATYAELYPERTGRLVLDGAMDPSLPAEQMNLDQTAGFETAFRSFAKDCVGQSDCPLGTKNAEGAGRRLTEFFLQLDKQPIPAGDRRLGESLATTGVIAAMYDEGAWPQLRDALGSAMKDRDGSGLLQLSDSYYERQPDGSYGNIMFANAAVNCLDLPAAFKGPDEVEKALPEFEKTSPVFGTGLAWAGLTCTYWPEQATGSAHRITAEGAAPLLVVGTTRDPATPYKWAESLAGQLATGTLLTYDGDGHTAYGRGSDCIDTAVNRYLLDGKAPEDGKRC
ncbi:alpha/beta hydrolase [Streptomyces indicus]|uniref:Alpha/beta hydrolase fold n=1 Tax=Streptomyces indicus TaxID=417292 RepID=A0A1G9BXS3_9ACTN|nr:alpha/beta hydrolase [Streptomyces indicus]SDK44207.1 alpha/beta hydrolase fold [Streptomyces indicus]